MPPKKAASKKDKDDPLPSPSQLPTPATTDQSLRMSYRIARGEQGVLTFEPYKSLLLPYWRFRTVPIARTSSTHLKTAFDSYVARGDFVGADMSRKFIQMGMTRAKRYANHKGGRKYEIFKGVRGEEGRVKGGADGKGVQREKGEDDWEGREEKREASEVFKGVWRVCIADEKYLALKKAFQEEQKAWDRAGKEKGKKKVKKEVKQEYEDEGGDVKVEVKEESDDDG